MFRTFLLSLALLAAAALSACGGAGSSAEENSDSSSGAKAQSQVTFSTSDIPSADFELTHVEATLHTMRMAGKEYPAMIIQMANYDRGGGSYHPGPKEEGQRRVTINFSGTPGDELKPGVYEVGGPGRGVAFLSIGVEGLGKQAGLYNGEGSGEILSFDGDSIVAKVRVQDQNGTTVEATVATEYEVSRY